MATSANAINVPASIAIGGTNATSMATSTGIVKYDGTRLVTSSTALIDSSNRILNSSQPLVVAVNGTVANVTGDNTLYTLPFGTEITDQGGNFSGGAFTAPVTGNYLVTLKVNATNLSATHTSGAIYMIINGVFTTYGAYGNYFAMSRIDNATYTASDTQIISIGAGGVLTFYLQVFGASKTVGILGGDALNYTTTVMIALLS